MEPSAPLKRSGLRPQKELCMTIRPTPAKLAIATIAAATLGNAFGAASAADLDKLNEMREPASDQQSNEYWTGFYAGLSAGFQSSNSVLEHEGLEFDGLGGDGVTGCLNGGADYQADRFIGGVWGEGCLSNAESFLDDGGREVVGIEEDWSAGVGLRGGIAAWSRTALFLKGGYRWSEVSFHSDIADSDELPSDRTYGGWLAGAEMETYLSENVTLKISADHTWFGDEDFGDVTVERSETRGLIGANYRF